MDRKRRARRHKFSKGERREAALLAAAFGLGILRAICSAIPGLQAVGALAVVGWIAIPPIWLMRCAWPRRGQENAPLLGMGALASLLSCVILWTTPRGTPEQWAQLLLPSVAIAALAAVGFALLRRGMSLGRILTVGLTALLVYAPAVSLCLNEVLPAWSERVDAAEVLDLSSEYSDGDWDYYAVIESNGVEDARPLTRDEYVSLQEGGKLEIHSVRGLLGIEYQYAECS